MTEQQTAQARQDLLMEVNALLRGLDLDLAQGLYVEGEGVALLLDPQPSPQTNYFHLLVTVVPLGSKITLAELPLLLQGLGNLTYTCYGSLNGRGQLHLQNLPAGHYQVALPADTSTALLPLDWLARLPALLQPLWRTAAVSIAGHYLGSALQTLLAGVQTQYTYVNADSSLLTLLQRQGKDQVSLTWQTNEKKWDGAVVGLAWCARCRGTQPLPEVQLYYARLRWDERSANCSAQLQLPPMAEVDWFCLPTHPWWVAEALAVQLLKNSGKTQEYSALSGQAATNASPQRPTRATERTIMPQVIQQALAKGRSWVRDHQGVLWIDLAAGIWWRSTDQPILIVRGAAETEPAEDLLHFTLGADELGNLDLTVQAIRTADPERCTLIIYAQVVDRWLSLGAVKVILLRHEETRWSLTDASGKAIFAEFPVADLPRLGLKIVIPDG